MIWKMCSPPSISRCRRVGGLSVPQAIETLALGAEIVVFGAPLVISGKEFKAADPNFDRQLREIVKSVRDA